MITLLLRSERQIAVVGAHFFEIRGFIGIGDIRGRSGIFVRCGRFLRGVGFTVNKTDIVDEDFRRVALLVVVVRSCAGLDLTDYHDGGAFAEVLCDKLGSFLPCDA